MEKIIKKDGYVYAYDANDKKGFETFYNLGKDIDDPRWDEKIEEINTEKPKKRKEKSED